MTAVEWLVQRMKHICKWDEYMLLENLGHIDKAKQMEKEQIIDAHIEGQRVFDKHDHTQWTTDQAEQYYIEIYKNK